MDQVLVKRRLMARAAEVSNCTYDREYQSTITNLMHEPQFEKKVKQHDWRNYIDDEVQAIWSSLLMQARIALYINAESMTESEIWD